VAYSNQFLRLSWLFGVAGSDEIAVTGLNYTTAPGWTGAEAALAELVAADTGDLLIGDMNSLMSTAEIQWAGYSQLTGIKIAAIGTDGAYLTEPYIVEDESPSDGSTQQTPPQLSIVISLLSGFTLGAGNRGRMYLPHCHLGMATDSPVSNGATTDAVAAAAADFVNAVTGHLDDDLTAVVFPAIMSQVGAGSAKGVTAVSVGSVTDTQRRRRDQLTEIYSTVTLA